MGRNQKYRSGKENFKIFSNDKVSYIKFGFKKTNKKLLQKLQNIKVRTNTHIVICVDVKMNIINRSGIIKR